VRLRAIGDLERLPPKVLASLQNSCQETADRRELDLILAVSYGGRDEIARAARQVAELVSRGILSVNSITPQVLAEHLYAPDVPDPDLLIRTSSECRISNFLLWQLAYSEIVISPAYWPAFSKEEYRRCLEEYGRRDRRYGLTGEQTNVVRQP
jgi:undecaprenyl diphosphate synthase